MINITLSILLGVRSFRPDHSAMLLSSARHKESPFLLNAILDSIIFKPRWAVDTLLHYQPVQANATANALPCQPLRITFALSRIWASPSLFKASPFELDSHSFKPCTLKPHVPSLAFMFPNLALTFPSLTFSSLHYELHPPDSTLLSLIFRVSFIWVSSCWLSILSNLTPLHKIIVCGHWPCFNHINYVNSRRFDMS